MRDLTFEEVKELEDVLDNPNVVRVDLSNLSNALVFHSTAAQILKNLLDLISPQSSKIVIYLTGEKNPHVYYTDFPEDKIIDAFKKNLCIELTTDGYETAVAAVQLFP